MRDDAATTDIDAVGAATAGEPTLARKLGVFDATMIVMGGIIGAGIFVNPSVVARQVHTPALEVAAWAVGSRLDSRIAVCSK